MRSALEDVDTKDEVKTAIGLAAADFKVLEKKSETGMKTADCDESPFFEIHGYKVYEC